MALRVKNLEVGDLTAPEIDALFSRLVKKLLVDSKSDIVTINILFVGDINIPKPKALKLLFECAATIGSVRVRQMLASLQVNSPSASPQIQVQKTPAAFPGLIPIPDFMSKRTLLGVDRLPYCLPPNFAKSDTVPCNTNEPTPTVTALPSVDAASTSCAEQLMTLQSADQLLIEQQSAQIMRDAEFNSHKIPPSLRVSEANTETSMPERAVNDQTPSDTKGNIQLIHTNLPVNIPPVVADPCIPDVTTDDGDVICCANQSRTPTSRPSHTSLVDLRCSICEKITHYACLKKPNVVRPRPIPGDTTYTFLCRRCSPTGSERFAPGDKRWVEIVRLSLYNLWLSSGCKREYFKCTEDIIKYIDEHWNLICPNKPRTATWQGIVYGIFSRFGQYFKNGAQQTGHSGWWGLVSYTKFEISGFATKQAKQVEELRRCSSPQDSPSPIDQNHHDATDSENEDSDMMIIDDEIKNSIVQNIRPNTVNGNDTMSVSNRTPLRKQSKRSPKVTILQLMHIGLVCPGDVITYDTHSTTVRENGSIGDKDTCMTISVSRWVKHVTCGRLTNGWGAKLRRGNIEVTMKSLRDVYLKSMPNDNKPI